MGARIKIFLCVACLASSLAAPAQQPAITLDIIDMAAISRMSPQQLEVLAEGLAAAEIMRTKRSSAQAISSAVSKASSGLQSKVGFLGQASAGAASFIASASSASSKSGGHDEHPGYSYEPHDEKVDYWGLKKSILYTLFQAVKAITGGVTILKGQLIKGGGALATTLGKVIAVKGDAVSNFGKKIVSSAALSSKKPHSTPVYGPPPPTHIDYAPPSAYGAPTAPAHFAHSAPSAPTGYAAHKYPAHLDGRTKLNGVHAGLVILAPLGAEGDSSAHAHTPLEPPPNIANSVYTAIKNVFTSPEVQHTAPTAHAAPIDYQQPPPPPEIPAFKPMSWGAVDSYGQPAAGDTFNDYDPHHPHTTFNRASSKYSTNNNKILVKSHGPQLNPDKINKINQNVEKLNKYIHHYLPLHNKHDRSSEEMAKLNSLTVYTEMLKKGQVSLLPTPVMTDGEIGVLPADLLPDSTSTSTSTTTTTSSTTTTTTEKSSTESSKETKRDKKEVKYYLRGNKIIVQG